MAGAARKPKSSTKAHPKRKPENPRRNIKAEITMKRRGIVQRIVQIHGYSDVKTLTERVGEELGKPPAQKTILNDLDWLYGDNEAWIHDQTKRTWMLSMQKMSTDTKMEIESLLDILAQLMKTTKTDPHVLSEAIASLPLEDQQAANVELRLLLRSVGLKGVAPTILRLMTALKEHRVFLTELMTNKPIYEHVQEMSKRFDLLRDKEGALAKSYGK